MFIYMYIYIFNCNERKGMNAAANERSEKQEEIIWCVHSRCEPIPVEKEPSPYFFFFFFWSSFCLVFNSYYACVFLFVLLIWKSYFIGTKLLLLVIEFLACLKIFRVRVFAISGRVGREKGGEAFVVIFLESSGSSCCSDGRIDFRMHCWWIWDRLSVESLGVWLVS